MPIFYRDVGKDSAPVIVFLHGWMHSGEDFIKIADVLDSYRCLLIDLPGFCRSSLLPDDWDVGSYARFLETFVAVRDLNPVAYVGHSFGCRVLTKLFSAEKKPETSLILICPAGKEVVTSSPLVTIAKLIKKIPILRRICEPVFRSFRSEDCQNAGKHEQLFRTTVQEDLTHLLEKITTRTLTIWGKNDDQIPLEYLTEYDDRISNHTSIVLDGDHNIPDTHPVEIAREIHNFLTR